MQDEVATDLPLLAKEAAAEVGLSLAAFWRAVGAGRLPQPVYPLPRARRWFRSELRAALLTHRMLPADAKAVRRATRIATEQAAA
jgi:predicted DNA-binding transcriptional regulator AlpA